MLHVVTIRRLLEIRGEFAVKGIINYFQSLVRKSITEEIIPEEEMTPARKNSTLNKDRLKLAGNVSSNTLHYEVHKGWQGGSWEG